MSAPGRNVACVNANRPAPRPPAAPAPGVSVTCRPMSRLMTSLNRARARSSSLTVSLSAPFCGPKIADAPVGPHRGLLTSQATSISALATSRSIHDASMRSIPRRAAPPRASSSPVESSSFAPMACAMPAPPSFVALPPIPMINFRYPRCTASNMS